jgi:hypothetical protein
MYDSDGRLTLDGAKQVIQSGGSVLIAGQLHNDVRTLPNVAKLSTINAVSRKQAEDAINGGGSFTWHGKKYNKVADLPDAEDFDAKNREASTEAREQLQKEIDDRQAQLDEADRLSAEAAEKTSRAEALRAGRKPGAAGAGSASGVESADELHDLTVPDLKAKADGLGIESTSGMNKNELVKAIRKAEKDAAK